MMESLAEDLYGRSTEIFREVKECGGGVDEVHLIW